MKNKVFNRVIVQLVTVLILISCAGCSVFVPWRQDFSVVASESHAHIYVNGQLVGTGHAETTVLRSHNVAVMAEKDGCSKHPALGENCTSGTPVKLVLRYRSSDGWGAMRHGQEGPGAMGATAAMFAAVLHGQDDPGAMLLTRAVCEEEACFCLNGDRSMAPNPSLDL